MAVESKSVSVNPSDEQSQIELWQDFGWTLKSSQEVYNKDSHLEDRGGDTYSVTTTTNYVKLVFSRDTEMKNYKEIVALENEFDSLEERSIPGPYFNKFWFISFLIYGIGLVLFIILKLANKKKKQEAYEYNNQIYEKRRELREKARNLVN